MAFWDKYYNNEIPGDNTLSNECSTFALWVLRYLEGETKLIDLGCGNGRDSVFMDNCGFTVLAVDNSVEAIRRFGKEHPGIGCVVQDLGSMTSEMFTGSVCYSRFSLHSITEAMQYSLLSAISRAKGCILCIETRSVNDPRYGVGTVDPDCKDAFTDTHYRRFVEKDQFGRLLNSLGFRIITIEEEFTDANYEDDKAVVIRVIAKTQTA